jgi:hypothetical protein
MFKRLWPFGKRGIMLVMWKRRNHERKNSPDREEVNMHLSERSPKLNSD